MLMSLGEIPASAKAALAAYAVMSDPTRDRELREKRAGGSVARVWPAMRTAWDRRSGRAWRKDSETIMAAAAPSEVGQHCNLVRGLWITGEASISAREYSVRNCEYGFLTE